MTILTVLAGVLDGQSQTTVQVDSTKIWGGYMNVYDIVGGGQGAYRFGSPWGLADLRGAFNSTNYLWLTPCTNIFNPADPYWVNPDGTGNKWMEANFYIDTGTALQGQTVTFTGTALTNSLVAPYSSVAFIKEFAPGYAYVGMTTEPLVAGSPFTVVRTINPGNITQYGFMTTGPDANPTNLANLGEVAIAVNNADPSLSALPGQALVAGQTANFTVTAKGTTPFSYQWTFMNATTTNILVNDSRISGANTNSLTISNVALADAGTYAVTVTNTHGSAVASAFLAVVPLEQAATNLLIDPGFEQGYFTYSADAGWFPFNGAVVASTNDYYYLSPNHVTVVNGAYCTQTYSSGPNSYNGIYQDRPALPGQIYTGNCWFLTPSDDPITFGNVCYLEVQFRDANNAPLIQYSSDLIGNSFPQSTWINLAPTNIHAADFTTPLGTASYMVAPPGTAKVRFQVTYHGVDGFGSVYVDAATLQLRSTALTASQSGGSIHLSFPTLYGPAYQVYYRTNLTDAGWLPLGSPVPGDGTVKTLSDPITGSTRFYTVDTQ